MKKIIILFVLFLFSPFVFADNFTQAIQVVNLLANHTLEEPGMTPTPIIVKYYNGSTQPCWYSTLYYQQDTTIHAGPTQGCNAKVDRVEIMPMLVANKLETYAGPKKINIDTSKYASQITVIQDQAPSFDPKNGMVITPGTVQIKLQAQYHS